MGTFTKSFHKRQNLINTELFWNISLLHVRASHGRHHIDPWELALRNNNNYSVTLDDAFAVNNTVFCLCPRCFISVCQYLLRHDRLTHQLEFRIKFQTLSQLQTWWLNISPNTSNQLLITHLQKDLLTDRQTNKQKVHSKSEVVVSLEMVSVTGDIIVKMQWRVLQLELKKYVLDSLVRHRNISLHAW